MPMHPIDVGYQTRSCWLIFCFCFFNNFFQFSYPALAREREENGCGCSDSDGSDCYTEFAKYGAKTAKFKVG